MEHFIREGCSGVHFLRRVHRRMTAQRLFATLEQRKHLIIDDVVERTYTTRRFR